MKHIHNMSVLELQNSIDLKGEEYKEAIKAKKLFWELKIIFDEKRELEKQLALKNSQ